MEKPQKNSINFYRTEGNYNLLNSKDKSAQYRFHFPNGRPEDIATSFLIDIEKDENYSEKDMTPLELAEWILSVYESYWIHTGKGDVQKLIDYLRAVEPQEAVKRAEWNVENAKYQIWDWNQKLAKFEKELEQAKEDVEASV